MPGSMLGLAGKGFLLKKVHCLAESLWVQYVIEVAKLTSVVGVVETY